MLFFYSIPTFCMAAIVVGLTLAAALFGHFVAHRLKSFQLDAEQRAITLAMVSIVTTINSLLVAFAYVTVWDAYNEAERTVAAEATCAKALAHDVAAFESPEAALAFEALRTYLHATVHQEWPMLQQQARPDPETSRHFYRLIDAANRITPASPRQSALLAEVLARTNELIKLREHRLLILNQHMPVTLWAVILIVSTLSFALLYALPRSSYYLGIIAIWAATLGLAYFCLLAVDRPFAGEVSISAQALQETLDTLDLPLSF